MLFRSKSLFESVEAASELREHVGACQGRRGEQSRERTSFPGALVVQNESQKQRAFRALGVKFCGISIPRRTQHAEEDENCRRDTHGPEDRS